MKNKTTTEFLKNFLQNIALHFLKIIKFAFPLSNIRFSDPIWKLNLLNSILILEYYRGLIIMINALSKLSIKREGEIIIIDSAIENRA